MISIHEGFLIEKRGAPNYQRMRPYQAGATDGICVVSVQKEGRPFLTAPL